MSIPAIVRRLVCLRTNAPRAHVPSRVATGESACDRTNALRARRAVLGYRAPARGVLPGGARCGLMPPPEAAPRARVPCGVIKRAARVSIWRVGVSSSLGSPQQLRATGGRAVEGCGIITCHGG